MSSSSNSDVKRSRSNNTVLKDAFNALNTVWRPFMDEDGFRNAGWNAHEERVEEIEKAHGVLAKAMFTNTDARIPTGPYIAFHEAMTAFLKTYALGLVRDHFPNYTPVPVFRELEKVRTAHLGMVASLGPEVWSDEEMSESLKKNLADLRARANIVQMLLDAGDEESEDEDVE